MGQAAVRHDGNSSRGRPHLSPSSGRLTRCPRAPFPSGEVSPERPLWANAMGHIACAVWWGRQHSAAWTAWTPGSGVLRPPSHASPLGRSRWSEQLEQAGRAPASGLVPTMRAQGTRVTLDSQLVSAAPGAQYQPSLLTEMQSQGRPESKESC